MSLMRSNHDPAESTNQMLYWAFAISVAGHLFIWGGYELGLHLKWWNKDLMPRWLTSVTLKKPLELKEQQKLLKQLQQQQEPPLMFVEVDPEVITAEAPKNAKFYSSKNSQAANVDAKVENSNNPKITGTQKNIPKTQDAQRTKSVPLQPSAPKQPAQEQPEQQAESKPKPKGGQPVGDLAMAKPSQHQGEGQTEDTKDPGETLKPVHKRANTLVEAKMREALAGHKMQEDGGVKRHLRLDSLDAKATPFGEYDRQLIEAIQNRWFDLLESKSFSRDRAGRVVLEFNLNYDGRITEMRVVENTVDEVLSYVCQRAVLDPAPYAPWPTDMRKILDADKRDVRFTFYYE